MGSRFTGGAQLVSVRMAEQLGDRVVLRAPVRRIDQDATGASVVSDAGTWRSKRVVAAVPPQLAARIQWNPLLPVAYETLFQRLPMGSLTKAEAIYDRPFWRPALIGMAVNINGGPVWSMFDNSPHDADPSGLAGAPGVLMGFVGGHAWRAWREWQHKPAAERRKAVHEVFAAAVGDQALNPVGYFEQGWAREHWTLRSHFSGRHRHHHGFRPRHPSAVRAGALGRCRDLTVLERIHGRRGALR